MKVMKINVYAAVVGFFLAGMAPVALADEAEQRIFFFGNSYTYFHNGLEWIVKNLLEEALNTTVEAQASTYNGAQLPRHLQDLDGTYGDTAPRQALITGNNTSWDLVVLQDQSGVPAYTYSELWWDSLNAGVELNNLIEPTGAVTMFLLTWGRQMGLDGDPLFTDFPIMQEYLNFGYRQYQLAANNPRSFVAPAGIAFQLIYDDTIAAGGTSADSPFRDLYSNDGSHPSWEGSYLSALVIYAAYTGLSVAELEWVPGGIGAERRDYLQSIADEAVFDDDTFFPSRWDITGPNDFKPTASPISNPTNGGTDGGWDGDFGGGSDGATGRTTYSPSVSPLAKPSVTPSAAPSTSPSAAPSVSPSIAPSVSPSVKPSVPPSAAPTTDPSVVPSVAPSVSPSAKPSVPPSTAPTTIPSTDPSVVPSVAPSVSPSVMASVSPSRGPTTLTGPPQAQGDPLPIPTAAPSIMPSIAPSVSPAVVPSISPSAATTASPSVAPSVTPSLLPPSAEPSVATSVAPVRSPSVAPSVAPWVSPSVMHSAAPSEAPSTIPSTASSVSPSVAPSVSPSAKPSVPPSAAPTKNPSGVPSGRPSVAPSVPPSEMPSVSPSTVPSALPTPVNGQEIAASHEQTVISGGGTAMGDSPTGKHVIWGGATVLKKSD